MEEPRLLQESQAEPPGDGAVAAKGHKGTCLDVRDTVVGLSADP